MRSEQDWTEAVNKLKLEIPPEIKAFLKRHGAVELVAEARRRMSHRMWQRRTPGLTSSVPFGLYKLDAAKHYGDYILDDSWAYIEHCFVVERLDFIIQTLGVDEVQKSSFADIGDSDGTFLRALGKKGMSINCSETVLANIPDLQKIKGCLPAIDLPDQTFDYVLLFETLEHLTEPITGLCEVERLARKGAFVSIPHVSKTRLNCFWNNAKLPVGESHVFEFSPRDLAKAITYTGFAIDGFRRVRVFAPPRSLLEFFVCAASTCTEPADVRCGCFKAFDVYYLRKKPT